MIAFPKNRQYPAEVKDMLKDMLGSDVSKYPILIEGEGVEKHGSDYALLKGDITKSYELPNLHLKNGCIQAWDNVRNLPTKVGSKPNPEFFGAHYWITPEGIRPVRRGDWYWLPRERGRFNVAADWGLSIRTGTRASAPQAGKTRQTSWTPKA